MLMWDVLPHEEIAIGRRGCTGRQGSDMCAEGKSAYLYSCRMSLCKCLGKLACHGEGESWNI